MAAPHDDACPPGWTIRAATPEDSRAMFTICLETGDSGADGTALFPDDPDALGRLYSQPYLELAPEFAWVLEDDKDVCGYCLAALDSRTFNDAMTTSYLPGVQSKFPCPPDGPDLTHAQRVHRSYHHFEPMLPPALERLYPSHLHIDIVARAQRKGHGSRLIRRQLQALTAAGSVGVHLGMAPKNLSAYKFYKKLGFQELVRLDDDLVLGMRLQPSPPPSPTPPFLTGVIEGFYGRPWSPDQRERLCGYMEKWGMQLYMYGPKDDRKHRYAWRELYTPAECDDLHALVAACSRRGVDLIYAIGPGLDMKMSDPRERQLLHAKLSQVLALGVRRFALLFDDIPERLCEEDAARFSSQAEGQAAVANDACLHIMNELLTAGGASDASAAAGAGAGAGAGAEGGVGVVDTAAILPPASFLFCPTEYCMALARPSLLESPYLTCVGEQLMPQVSVFWTGPHIISKTMTVYHAEEVAAVLRRPPMIWDNLHANDYDNGRRMYLGPYNWRNPSLATVVQGVLSNPNCEFEANFVPLRTLSMFGAAVRSGKRYSPRHSFLQACEEWLPHFQPPVDAPAGYRPPLTLDQVVLLGDLLYLPFKHGKGAAAYLDAVKAMAVPHGTWTTLSDAEQASRTVAFVQRSDAITAMAESLNDLHNRELLYTLYRFVWDIKEQVELLREFVAWLHAPDADGRDPDEGFVSKYHAPGAIRGGFVQHCMDVLSFDLDGRFKLITAVE